MATKVDQVNIVQIEDLGELIQRNPDFFVPVRDAANKITYKLKIGAIISSETVSAGYSPTENYNDGRIVQANGKWWQSLINDGVTPNIGNYPIEGSFWTEISKSVADGAVAYWSAGVFTTKPQISIVGDAAYLLKSAVVLPFNSTISPDLDAANWKSLGSDDNLTVVKVDSATTTTHNAVKNTIVLYNTTTAPSTCVVPDPVVGNSDLFAFKNVGTTHKLTVRTVSGTIIAIIPSIDTMVQIKCNGIGYDILNDTRALWLHEHVTTSRLFTADGLEDNVMYIYELTTNEVMTLPPPSSPLNNKAYQSHHELKGTGTVTFVREDGGLIGGKTSQVIAITGTGFDIVEADGEYHLMYDSRPKAPNTSFVSYPLTESTAIVDSVTGLNFLDRALSIDDADFNKVTQTFVSTPITANPTDPYQQLQPSICPQGAIQGLIPEGTIDIFWNLYKTGAIDLDVYVSYSKRSALGVETLICNSQIARVSNTIEAQVNVKAVHGQFNIDPTDYIVIRRFARKVSTGVNPTFSSGSEGANPTRSIIEVSAANISHESISGRSALHQHPAQSIDMANGDTAEEAINKKADLLIVSKSATINIPLSDLKSKSQITLSANSAFNPVPTDDELNLHQCELLLNGFTATFPGFTFMETQESVLNTTASYVNVLLFWKMAGIYYYTIANSYLFTVPDVNPPVLSATSISNIANITATLNVTTNEAATLFWAVYSQPVASKSNAEIIAGTGANAFGSYSISVGANSNQLSGLLANTAQYVVFFARDTSANESANATIQFTTTSISQLPAPTITALTASASRALLMTASGISPLATGVTVEYKLATDSVYTVHPTTMANNATTFLIESLLLSSQYNVRIKAVGDGVNYLSSNYSNVFSQTTGSSLYDMHFAASDPTNGGAVPSDGAAITTWSDISGNAKNIIAQTGGYVYSTVLPAAMQSLNDIFYNSTVRTKANYLELFAVVKKTALAASDQTLYGYRSGSTQLVQLTYKTTGTVDAQLRSSGNVLKTASTAFGTSSYQIVRMLFDRSGNKLAVQVNNNAEVSIAHNIGTEAVESIYNGFCGINTGFWLSNTDAMWQGAIAELILIGDAITTQQRADIYTYLNGKFSIY